MLVDSREVAATLTEAWVRDASGLDVRLASVLARVDGLFVRLEREVRPVVAVEAGLEGALGRFAWDAAQGPLRELLSRGGKRFRAVLCYAQTLAEGGEPGVPCLLVELVHNASLIADDIEDASPLRRGLPVVHEVCGIGPALNSANWGYFLAPLLFETQGLPSTCTLELHRCYNRCLRKLHLGQALDIHWHSSNASWPSSADYLAMCRLKTGALLRLAAECALVPQGVSTRRAGQLSSLWEDVGQAFQMIDDLQNLSCGNDGKVAGDDLLEGKKSWPLLCDLERLRGDERAARQRWLEGRIAVAQSDASDPRPRAEVSEALFTEGVMDRCRTEVVSLLQDCWRRLCALYPQINEGGRCLFDLLLLCYRGLEQCRSVRSPGVGSQSLPLGADAGSNCGVRQGEL